MRKNTSLLLAIVLLLSLVLPMNAIAADAGLKITGDVAAEKTITLDELKAMDTVTATYGALNSSNTYSETEFTGVKLADVLALAGVKTGATTLNFVSSDGYKSTKSMDILSAKYLNDLSVILAWDADGNIQVVIPQKDATDVNKSSWARQLVEINVAGAPAASTGDSPAASSGAFTDVPDNHPAADYIADIFNRGITTGDTATTFGPDKTLTRAQFVTFLGRLFDIKVTKYAEGPFSDIEGAGVDYAIGHINWAFKSQITTGITASTFVPSDKVTRQQVATFIYRYAAYTATALRGTDATIKDAGDVASWAKDGVAAAVKAGLMDLTDGKFRPNDYCTRAEMAQVLSLFPAVMIGDKSYTMAEISALASPVSGEYKYGEGTRTGYYVGVKLGTLLGNVSDSTEILVQTSDSYPKEGSTYAAKDAKNFILAFEIGATQDGVAPVTQPYLITGTEQLKYVNRITVGGLLGK